MMSESVEVRRSERRPMLDIAMPIRRAPQTNGVSQDNFEALPTPAAETVKFSLLSKRGNRPQVCSSYHYSKVLLLTPLHRHATSTFLPTQASPSRCVHNKKPKRQNNNESRSSFSTMICTPRKMPPNFLPMVTAHPLRTSITGPCVVLEHTIATI